MSKRMDNIVNELTNYIENQMQTEVEMALGVKHRKDVGVPMFGCMCFICKDGGSANILVNYLQNNMGFELTCRDGSCYSLTSKAMSESMCGQSGTLKKCEAIGIKQYLFKMTFMTMRWQIGCLFTLCG